MTEIENLTLALNAYKEALKYLEAKDDFDSHFVYHYLSNRNLCNGVCFWLRANNLASKNVNLFAYITETPKQVNYYLPLVIKSLKVRIVFLSGLIEKLEKERQILLNKV